MSTLVVQTYLTGHWRDALRLVFDDPRQGPQQGACTLSYLAAYLRMISARLRPPQ
ncbi:hypothetical protein [Pseudomonas sp. PS02302]|uniref:hypothetical protein n=1 Tax=Pseudomonas sp. PS02302 TaxID=2991428 RepID=UPI003014B179